jgi:hypothetical protein
MKIKILNLDVNENFFKALDYLLTLTLPLQTAWLIQDIKEVALKRSQRFNTALDEIMEKYGAVKNGQGWKLEGTTTAPEGLKKEIAELENIGYNIEVETSLTLPEGLQYPGYINEALKMFLPLRKPTAKEVE